VVGQIEREREAKKEWDGERGRRMIEKERVGSRERGRDRERGE
jgi:hypothetical protein